MANTEGIGTKKAGYADPHYGPFLCGNCIWLRPGATCAHPEVNADPQVPKNTEGHAQIDTNGCCNEFRPKKMNISGLISAAINKKG